jgi:hypothetical protein
LQNFHIHLYLFRKGAGSSLLVFSTTIMHLQSRKNTNAQTCLSNFRTLQPQKKKTQNFLASSQQVMSPLLP